MMDRSLCVFHVVMVYGVPMDEELKVIPIGTWEVLKEGTDAAILTFGTTIPMAMEAAEELEQARYFS